MPEPLIVGGQPLRDSVDFEVDADNRMLTIKARAALDIMPVTMVLPWALLKKTAAQIMIFECDQMAGTTGARADYLRVKRQVAVAMLREADAEVAAAKGETPEPPPAAPGFDAAAG